jgi:transposase
MRKIREILRLHFESGMSIRQIAVSCSLSRAAVSDTIARATAAGVSWPLSPEMDDAQLESLLYPQALGRKAKPESAMPDMQYIKGELSRAGVTLQLLWTEYIADNPGGYQYSRYCQLYREWQKKTAEPWLHLDHKAGEEMMVDWAGQTMQIIDREAGEPRDVYIFIATLPASNYLYVEPFFSMSLENWIAGHVHALEFFGGVPQIIVPDNAKTVSPTYCYYEPELNLTYADMASYYNTAVVPTRVRHPKDKAKVEAHVLITYRSIMAPLRNRLFFSLADLRSAIFKLRDAVNVKPVQKLPGSRLSTFLDIEKHALKPLPEKPYEVAFFSKAKVNPDCHFELKKCRYSAPHHLIGTTLVIRYTATTVEALHNGKRVAIHPRVMQPGERVTLDEHLPRSKREYCQWTPESLIASAGKVGPNAAMLAQRILESKPHPMLAYRSCLGLLKLSRTYPPARVDAACARALKATAFSYKRVKDILEKGLDTVPFDEPANNSPVVHENLRGAQVRGR